jgi:hypothetical protein
VSDICVCPISQNEREASRSRRRGKSADAAPEVPRHERSHEKLKSMSSCCSQSYKAYASDQSGDTYIPDTASAAEHCSRAPSNQSAAATHASRQHDLSVIAVESNLVPIKPIREPWRAWRSTHAIAWPQIVGARPPERMGCLGPQQVAVQDPCIRQLRSGARPGARCVWSVRSAEADANHLCVTRQADGLVPRLAQKL